MSSRWALMERHDIPDITDPRLIYLTRWRLVRCPWFGVFLHKINLEDSRQVLHDHPWSFVSIVLRGGYWEQRLDKMSRTVHSRRVSRLNVMRRDDAHYVQALFREPTWTLVFVGKRRRTWGYLEPLAGVNSAWVWFRWDTFKRSEAT